MTTFIHTNMSCCGKKMKALEPQKANENAAVKVEIVEHDFYITTHHAVERDHSIVFVALVTNDSVLLKKLYPQWGL